jgi:hypothetical protein
MKNILGTTDDLELFHKDGDIAYKYNKYSNDSKGYWRERTYDERGNELTYKNSNDYWRERTYDEMGNVLTYNSSKGYSDERTYDEKGNELTYKNSDGVMRGFDIPEYTIEELKEMLGKEFKIKL